MERDLDLTVNTNFFLVFGLVYYSIFISLISQSGALSFMQWYWEVGTWTGDLELEFFKWGSEQ